MGKLVLTRRAGESVKLTEPNGREWLLTLRANQHTRTGNFIQIELQEIGSRGERHSLNVGETCSFAGGNVELRPHKRPDQAILAFDFPRDVTIVRTEIA